MTAVPSITDTPQPAREREALLLAELLRASRLTLLCGPAGSGKSMLLRTGLLPLLCQPVHAQGVEPGAAGPVAPRAGEPPRSERALVFDQWHGDALPLLCAQLGQALGEPGSAASRRAPKDLPALIRLAGRQLGLRPMILLDAFERHLELPPLRTDVQRFDEQWLQAVNDPSLDAHFLISMRVEARPLLERYRGRLHGLERNWLNLPARRVSLVVEPPQASPSSAPALAFPAPPAPAPAPAPAATTPGQPKPPDTSPAVPVPRLAAAVPTAGQAGPWHWQLAVLSTASGLLLAAGLALWGSLSGPAAELVDAAPGAGPVARAVGVGPTPTARFSAPAWPVLTGAAQRTDARVAAELMQHLPATLQGPALRIVHYDALQAARQDPNATLRVVAPLFPEELHLVVRADSPLRYVHEIRGHSIDTGPAAPGRAPTAAVLYERLFGEALPPALTRRSVWPEALAALAAGSTDVAVLVDAEPSAWWSEMTPAARAGLKLLALDPAAPESRLALQAFLPATLHPPGSAAKGIPGLALMSFLVTDDAPAAPGALDTARPPAAEADDALAQLARGLCTALPSLRRDGHPKWREAQPALYLPVGWPYAEPAQRALAHCEPTPVQPPQRPLPRPPTHPGASR